MRLRGERVNLKALLAAAEFVRQEYLRRLVTLRARAPRETSSPNYMYVQLSDMGKKGKSFTQWITGSSGESTTSPLTDRSKDEVKKQNEQLFTELDSLNREYKKLKQVVEQLDREYEESKDYDPVRRYEKLKGMVKRTILHLKLNLDEQGPQSQASASGGIGLLQGCKEYAFQMESLKKREERFAGMAKQDIITENEQMADQIKEIKRKCSIIRDLVGQLESQYERSKRYIMVQRYRLLKTMVKTLIHDQLL